MTHALRLAALAATFAVAAGAQAQPAAETVAATRAAGRALFGTEVDGAEALVAAVYASAALGGLDLVAVSGLSFSARRPGDGGLVAYNPTDRPVFLALPGDRMPAPLVPVAVSREAGRVASLVALVGDTDTLFGLRVPPRATVVYRPAGPADVRPRGLDE